MPRRNQGPKLRWIADRGTYYISFTVDGRSRKRSTGASDRSKAGEIFAEWLRSNVRQETPRRPQDVLVTDLLTDYGEERASQVAAPRVIGCAIEALTPFWKGKVVAEITPEHVDNTSPRGRNRLIQSDEN